MGNKKIEIPESATVVVGDARDRWSGQDGFNTVSLKNWIELCDMASIPHVEAEILYEIPIMHLLEWERHPKSVKEMYKQIRELSKDGTMLRWDCCASGDIKYNMSNGDFEYKHEYAHQLHITDARAYEILFEFPDSIMHILQRPWIKPRIRDFYPVEYRAYVWEGKLVGISNYYPQISLEEEPADLIIQEVKIVKEYTERLTGMMETPIRIPGLTKEDPDRNQKSFTADFITTEGDPIFLEGGPSVYHRADPCCFPTGGIETWYCVDTFLEGVPIATRPYEHRVEMEDLKIEEYKEQEK